MENLLKKLVDIGVPFAVNVLSAIAIFIIGRWVAKIVRRILMNVFAKREVDPTLAKFATSIIYGLLMVFIAIAAINRLGVQTASLVAVIGAAGLAVGLALQGSLANFAAGVMLIIFRPFKVGDFVEGGGSSGTVEEIGSFTTRLKTGDNKQVIIPNASMTSGNIVNYSTKATRRVDIVAGIGYDDDIDKARDTINKILKDDERVLSEPEPVVAVSELADSSVNFTIRAWVQSADYWGVYWGTTEAIKKQFDQEGISIPFPQQDVHLIQKTA